MAQPNFFNMLGAMMSAMMQPQPMYGQVPVYAPPQSAPSQTQYPPQSTYQQPSPLRVEDASNMLNGLAGLLSSLSKSEVFMQGATNMANGMANVVVPPQQPNTTQQTAEEIAKSVEETVESFDVSAKSADTKTDAAQPASCQTTIPSSCQTTTQYTKEQIEMDFDVTLINTLKSSTDNFFTKANGRKLEIIYDNLELSMEIPQPFEPVHFLNTKHTYFAKLFHSETKLYILSVDEVTQIVYVLKQLKNKSVVCECTLRLFLQPFDSIVKELNLIISKSLINVKHTFEFLKTDTKIAPKGEHRFALLSDGKIYLSPHYKLTYEAIHDLIYGISK